MGDLMRSNLPEGDRQCSVAGNHFELPDIHYKFGEPSFKPARQREIIYYNDNKTSLDTCLYNAPLATGW